MSNPQGFMLALCAALAACAPSTAPAPARPAGAAACPVPGTPGGPPFETPQSALAAAFHCYDPVTPSGKPAVLLVHGTSLDAQSNFSWNYVPALTALGWPVCTVDLPDFGQDDIQIAAEPVVWAIRATAARSNGRIKVLGYSQGGMIPRWALRFWPDTRDLVEEVVSISGSNHGTYVADGACAAGCPASNWQQAYDAHFIAALNRDWETLPGIDYTDVYSWNDEIVQPNVPGDSSTSLAGGSNVTNVAVQEVCPGHVADHLAMGSYDPVAWAIALDALDNPGPADPSRLDPVATCAAAFMPGVDPATFATDYGGMLMVIGGANANSARPTQEPPLKCYVAGR